MPVKSGSFFFLLCFFFNNLCCVRHKIVILLLVWTMWSVDENREYTNRSYRDFQLNDVIKWLFHQKENNKNKDFYNSPQQKTPLLLIFDWMSVSLCCVLFQKGFNQHGTSSLWLKEMWLIWILLNFTGTWSVD